jgi:hypothetical protein
MDVDTDRPEKHLERVAAVILGECTGGNRGTPPKAEKARRILDSLLDGHGTPRDAVVLLRHLYKRRYDVARTIAEFLRRHPGLPRTVARELKEVARRGATEVR